MYSKRRAGAVKDEGGLTKENSTLALGHEGSHLCEIVQNLVKKTLKWKPLDFSEKVLIVIAFVGSGVPHQGLPANVSSDYVPSSET